MEKASHVQAEKNTDWVSASCSRTIPRQKRIQNKRSEILAREPEPELAKRADKYQTWPWPQN